MINPEKKLSERGLEKPDQEVSDKRIENTGKILIKVNDLRDPSAREFSLEKLIQAIERLRTEDLFVLDKEYESDDFGKYMVFGTSESNSWSEAVKKAQAVEITLTTITKNFGIEHRKKATEVEIKVLISAREGKIFRFNFDNKGKYLKAGWDDVHLRKRLGESNEPNDFELVKDESSTKRIE